MLQDPPLVRQLAQSVGLRVRDEDLSTVSAWAKERIGYLRLSGVEDYARLLTDDSATGRHERELLTVQCSTGETYFFRDAGQIDLLATKLLPELIERRAGTRRLRLWSAGCASGEEAYTLAMLVLELAPRLRDWTVQILGTDISSAALSKARAGIYREWSFRALDAERRRRYFAPLEQQWQISPGLRQMVSFRQLDLLRGRFPDPAADLAEFDLIICRNVFIYLEAQASRHITEKFSRTLADGGYLVTGHNELFGHDTAPLHMHLYPQSTVLHKSSARPAPPVPWVAPATPPAPAPPVAPPPAIVQTAAAAAPALVARAAATARLQACDQLVLSAQQHASNGRLDLSERDCDAAIALSDLDPRPYFLLAQLAQERGNERVAMAMLKKVIYLDGSFVAAYLELGALYAQAGEAQRARQLYEAARAALAKLPAHTVIAPYNESRAADVLAYVQRLLDGLAGATLAVTVGPGRNT